MPRQNNFDSHTVTFGCRLNAYESAAIDKNLSAVHPKGAVVFNTCAVTHEAERQALQAIRRLRREKPDAFVIVTGCAAQLKPHQFESMPEVDMVLGNREKMAADFLKKPAGTYVNAMEVAPALSLGPGMGAVRDFLQIQNGCDHACTFCVITHARGPSQSVPIPDVINMAKAMVTKGAKELTLTGVDLTAYGQDLVDNPSLGLLTKNLLDSVPDLKRLRISSLDPAEVGQDLLDLMKEEPRLMPHFHISLQAGADLILKRMKRRHLQKDIVQFVKDVRDRCPDVAFGADVIAGFPTETDALFQETYDLLDDLKIPFLHVFPFSPRPGTPAARMPQVDREVVKQRASRLRRLAQKTTYAYLERFLSQPVQVLLEKEGFGYTRHYCPVLVSGKRGKGIGEIVDVTPSKIALKGKRLCLLDDEGKS